LGGVPLARHHRPHRGTRTADAEPVQRHHPAGTQLTRLDGRRVEATTMHIFRQVAALALAGALAAPLAAAAQDFPTRPVRIVVPYAAGGSGDLLARLAGDRLANLWGQQVIVDNRAGAGGLIGTEAAARAEPDGYTLHIATDGPLTVAASLHKRLPY